MEFELREQAVKKMLAIREEVKKVLIKEGHRPDIMATDQILAQYTNAACLLYAHEQYLQELGQ